MSDVPYLGSPMTPHKDEIARRESLASESKGPWRPGCANQKFPNAYSAV